MKNHFYFLFLLSIFFFFNEIKAQSNLETTIASTKLGSYLEKAVPYSQGRWVLAGRFTDYNFKDNLFVALCDAQGKLLWQQLLLSKEAERVAIQQVVVDSLQQLIYVTGASGLCDVGNSSKLWSISENGQKITELNPNALSNSVPIQVKMFHKYYTEAQRMKNGNYYFVKDEGTTKTIHQLDTLTFDSKIVRSFNNTKGYNSRLSQIDSSHYFLVNSFTLQVLNSNFEVISNLNAVSGIFFTSLVPLKKMEYLLHTTTNAPNATYNGGRKNKFQKITIDQNYQLQNQILPWTDSLMELEYIVKRNATIYGVGFSRAGFILPLKKDLIPFGSFRAVLKELDSLSFMPNWYKEDVAVKDVTVLENQKPPLTQVTVKNEGTETIHFLNLNYRVKFTKKFGCYIVNVSSTRFYQNLNLAPNASITLDFDTIFPNNQFTNLCVWSSLPNNHVDASPVNDYFCKNVLITANRELDPSALHLFPNPVSNTLFYTNETDFQNIKLLIYNNLGQLLKINDVSNQRISSIDVQNLPQGSYYYTLTQEGAMLKRGSFIKIED